MTTNLITLKQAAKELACSYTFAKSLVDRGKLRHIRDGRFVRIFADAIGEYLSNQTVSVAKPETPGRTHVPGIHFR